MKNLFEISSEEKQRILEMHQSATKKNYLSEQGTQPAQPANTQTQGIDIDGAKYRLTNVVKDAESLAKFLDYNPETRFMQVFCSGNFRCSGLSQISFEPYSDGKPSYWTMMREYAKMYLNEVAKQYDNKIIPTACSDSPGYVVYYENIEPKIKPDFQQKYGLDDKKYEEFSRYFGTIANYKQGLQSALRTQLNKLGACAAKSTPDERFYNPSKKFD